VVILLDALRDHPFGFNLEPITDPNYHNQLHTAMAHCRMPAPTADEANEAAATGSDTTSAVVAIWLSRRMELSVAVVAPLVNLTATLVPKQLLQHCAAAVLECWRAKQQQ
jgi:hypothetical protein